MREIPLGHALKLLNNVIMKQLILILIILIPIIGISQNRLDVITPQVDPDSTVIQFTDDNKVGYIYQKGDSLYAKVLDSTFLLTSRLQGGVMHLTSSDTTHCTTIGTYYKIYKLGGFANGIHNGFTIDGNGRITFTGQKGTDCVFFGSSDVAADKQAELHYALYKNGSLFDQAESPIDINNPNKSKSIAINLGLPNLKATDYFEIWVRSDVASTVVTHKTLFITILGDR